MAVLLQMRESAPPVRYPLDLTHTRIGRLSSNEIPIPDTRVSRQHAVVIRSDDGYLIRDLGSMNGTYVNNEKVGEARLKPGDRITIGIASLVYAEEPSVPAQFSPDTGAPVAPALVKEPEASRFIRLEEIAAPEAPLRDQRALVQLMQIGTALLTSQGLEGVLNTIVDCIFRVIPAERAFVLLREGDRIIPRVARHRDGRTLDTESLPISRSIVNRAVEERLSILTADAGTDERFKEGESVVRLGIRSAMCVPLWTDQGVLGSLYVDCLAARGSFDEESLDLLTAMANQAALGIRQARTSERLRHDAVIRNRLFRYHSPNVVEFLMREADEGETLVPKEQEITVLFNDIVGFTTLSETLKPKEVSELLSQYFSLMTEIIFQHGGTLDKFIGDAIMAIFGAPLAQPEHPRQAVRAALEMRQELNTFLEVVEPDRRFTVRTGINTGMAMVGNLGSARRMEFTAIGDTVNTASRIQTLADPNQILLSEATHQRVARTFSTREVGEFPVKGKKQKVRVFEALDLPPASRDRTSGS
ncbi:MAG: FHA domain-containing protein [Nitrospirae bacterium]|nr:FHA domain-containing protein [Nitrospirota bacterium]